MPEKITVPALAVGVPTTTTLAFRFNETLYLERMSVLSAEGAGVLSEMIPPKGTEITVIFRLSTAESATRCRAVVRGNIPTTPGGLRLRAKAGDKVLPAITGAGISDSATAIFRMGDLEPSSAPSVGVGRSHSRPESGRAAVGFSIEFLDLDPTGRGAVDHHIETSQFLADRLAAQGGRSVKDDRLAVSETFHAGDLSKRALDW